MQWYNRMFWVGALLCAVGGWILYEGESSSLAVIALGWLLIVTALAIDIRRNGFWDEYVSRRGEQGRWERKL